MNIANGNLMVGASGLSMAGVNGLHEVISPTYNSISSSKATDLGNGWISGTGRDVGLDFNTSGSATFYDPTGHGYTFAVPSSCTFTPPAGIDAQLACSGSNYTLTYNASGLQYQFDSGGNLIAIQNRQGNQITFAYNTSGLLTQITNTEAQVTTISYDAQNRISQITSPGSPVRTWTYNYDGSNNLSQVTDPNNHTTTYGYDANSHLTKITDPLGNVTNISYDASNRVSQIVQVTNPSAGTGPTTSFVYNTGSTQVTDANSHTTTYAYDGSNRVTAVTDALNHTAQTTWTADNHVATAQLPSGATTTYTYDSLNNLTQVTSPTGVTKTLQYGDSSHPYLPTSVTDDRGNTTTTQYNSQGLPTTVTDSLNHTTTTAYNANGTVASVTDANNHQTTYTYNSLGLLTKITPPSPLGSTSYSYDGYDRVSGKTDGKGQSTGYSYDAVDHLLSTSYADGSSITNTYDADGNRLTMNGDLTDSQTGSQETVSDGSFEGGKGPWQTQPSTSNIVKYNPGQGQGGDNYYAELQSSFSNTQAIWQTVSVPSSYSKLTFSYWLRVPPNKSGTCSAFTAQIRTTTGTPITTVSNPCPSGYTSGWAQESVDVTTALASYKGKQVQVYFQDYTTGGAQTFDIDTVSLAAGTDKTTYTYNALNQPTVQAYLNGPTTNMTWDNVGNLLTKTVSSQTTSYTYTADNQLASVTNPANGTTAYTYDVDGNKTQQAYPNGVTESMSYNTAGQLTQIAATNSANTTLTSFAYSYTNPNTGKLTDLPYSVTDVAGKTTTYTYDAASEMTQAVQKSSSGSTLATFTYAYDPVGNKTSQNLNGASTSFSYNAADEVTQASGAINKTYSWDANGNQTSASGGATFTYNTANQTTSITPSGGSTVNMGYTGPGEGQRVTAGSKTYQWDIAGMSTIITSSGTTTITMDPGGNLLSEQNPTSGMMLAKAKRGARPRSQPATGGSTYYYLTDGIGSIVGLTDSSGNLVDQYSYDPQGNYTSQSGSVPNSFGYGGMTYDSSTGLYSSGDGGGYYDPSVGQYSQGGSCDAYGGGGMCMEFNGYDPFNWVYEEASFATPDNRGYCEVGVMAFKSAREYRGQYYLYGWADIMCTIPVSSVDVYIYAQEWNALPVFGGLFGWGYYQTEGMANQGYCHFDRPVPWHEYRCPKNRSVDAVWLDVGHGKWRFLAESCTDWLNGYRTCGVDVSRGYQF